MTDFTISITDPNTLDAISWARARDNANPGRAAGSEIKTDQDWLQIEAVNLLGGLVSDAKAALLAAAIDAAKAGDPTKLQALAPSLAENI